MRSDQKHSPPKEPAHEQWHQTFALEKAHDEIILLQEQISSLQQYLSEQLQEQQVAEQDLHYASQELERTNVEVQLMVETKWLFFEEIKELMRTFPGNKEISKESLLPLFGRFYSEIDFSQELEPAKSTFSAH